MIGHVGTFLGEANVNIAFMAEGRLAPAGEAQPLSLSLSLIFAPITPGFSCDYFKWMAVC